MERDRNGTDDGATDSAGARERRLKAALKANMERRKAQARARGAAPNHHGRRRVEEEGRDG